MVVFRSDTSLNRSSVSSTSISFVPVPNDPLVCSLKDIFEFIFADLLDYFVSFEAFSVEPVNHLVLDLVVNVVFKRSDEAVFAFLFLSECSIKIGFILFVHFDSLFDINAISVALHRSFELVVFRAVSSQQRICFFKLCLLDFLFFIKNSGTIQ